MNRSADHSTTSPGTGSGERRELKRTLGLFDTLTIGTGTMVGAGIFLFPGLAGGKAGMAATLSFAVGALVALFVALPAAELATAMPRSGGAYRFVSRSMGSAAGTVVGIGQWVGLAFASAFYLSGFGRYLADLLRELGSELPVRGHWIAFGLALILTGLAMVDTGKVGRLQTFSVGLLVLLLGVVLTVGLFRQLTGPSGPIPAEGFAPKGWRPVLPTAALVFTSYLGFIQITTVAGDVRRPGRNLPLSLLGSIAVVGVLYLLTVFLTTSLFEAARLRALGETALTEVARGFLGRAGALIVFGGGLLATLSSSNASILASSRAVLALGRDPVLPSGAGRVNARFGTPHVAVALTGLPIAVLVLLGPLEVLAEVASSLHLLMYGLIAFSVIVLRTKDEEKYEPTFRTPGSPLLPLVGGLSSLTLIAWMQTTSLLIAAGVVAGSMAWHLLYVRSDVRHGGDQAVP